MSRRWTSATAVYCFGEGRGMPVKLGVSECIINRFQMIRTHTWRDMRPFWAWWGDEAHEAALKARFADRRIRNEWFADLDDEIKTLLPWNLPADGVAWPIKMQVQQAMRKARVSSFPGYRPCYGITHEKQFQHFDAALMDEIKSCCAALGIILSDADFAPRDGREIDAVLREVTA